MIYISLFLSLVAPAAVFRPFMYRLAPPSDARRYAAGNAPVFRLDGPEEPPDTFSFDSATGFGKF